MAKANQLTKEQFEHAILVFLVELNEKCADASESKLRTLPGFDAVIADYSNEFLELGQDASTLLRLAFAFVDEYVYADLKAVIDAAYSAYCLDAK